MEQTTLYSVWVFISKYLSFLFFYLSMTFFGTRYQGRKNVGVIGAAVAVSGSVLHVLDYLFISRMGYSVYVLAIFLLAFPFILWYYRAGVYPKMLFALIYMILMTVTRILFSTLAHYVVYDLMALDMKDQVFSVLVDVLVFLVLFGLCLIFMKVRFEGSELSRWEYFVFYAIGGINLYCALYFVGQAMGEGQYLLVIFMLFTILCTSVSLFLMVFRYTAVRKKSREQELVIQRMQMQEQSMKQVEESMAQYRQLRHELRNYMFYVEQLIKNKEYERLEHYIETIHCREYSVTDAIDTGNRVVSALLNQKKAFASSSQIQTDIQVMLPERCPFQDVELCSVIANLFDNAIEASRGLSGASIRIVIKPVKNYLSFQFQNRVEEDVITKNPGLHTTKGDQKNHGIGLKVVRSIVEKYDGILNFRMAEDQYFSVECMLKMEQGQEENE